MKLVQFHKHLLPFHHFHDEDNRDSQHRLLYGSLARISNIMTQQYGVQALPCHEWATGDYVVGKYLGPQHRNSSEQDTVETTSGKQVALVQGDWLVGSLGTRRATLEICGDWREMICSKDQENNDSHSAIVMQDICGSGLFGRETSRSSRYPSSACFQYKGHVVRQGRKMTMQDFVSCHPSIRNTDNANQPTNSSPIAQCPTVLIIGTSMSVGKTETARVVTKLLKKKRGMERLVYAKLTGSGYYHDILSMSPNVDGIIDFVDVGLPSTVMPADEYRQALRLLLQRITTQYRPDGLVVELGASPCEPYNGWVALQELDHADLVILCAMDAYAVLGMRSILRAWCDDANRKAGNLSSSSSLMAKCLDPDVVCGRAANTSAGRDLVQKLTGLPALSLSSPESIQELECLLDTHLVVS